MNEDHNYFTLQTYTTLTGFDFDSKDLQMGKAKREQYIDGIRTAINNERLEDEQLEVLHNSESTFYELANAILELKSISINKGRFGFVIIEAFYGKDVKTDIINIIKKISK